MANKISTCDSSRIHCPGLMRSTLSETKSDGSNKKFVVTNVELCKSKHMQEGVGYIQIH